jgi:hypothetical protein
MVAAIVALTLLHGTVRIGPTTPVCRAEVPCSKPAARVVLSFSNGPTRLVARTDMLGGYRLRLAPGRWVLTIRSGIRPTTIHFVVPRTSTATRNFTIDTGIR